MVLADLGRKITTALRSLSSATVINEEVRKTENFVPLNFWQKICEWAVPTGWPQNLPITRTRTVFLLTTNPVYLIDWLSCREKNPSALGTKFYAERDMCSATRGRCKHQTGEETQRKCQVYTCSKMISSFISRQKRKKKDCRFLFTYTNYSSRSVIDFDEMAAGLNKRRMIQSAVYKELVKVLYSTSIFRHIYHNS